SRPRAGASVFRVRTAAAADSGWPGRVARCVAGAGDGTAAGAAGDARNARGGRPAAGGPLPRGEQSGVGAGRHIPPARVPTAMAGGLPVLCCSHVGGMAVSSAGVAWARVGLTLPWRVLGAGGVRVAARRSLGASSRRARAQALAAWAGKNDGAKWGAELVDAL